MDSYVPQLTGIAALVVLSALFSASETALLALGPAGVHQILDEEGRHSGLLTLWRDRPNRILASLLIANNLANIMASAVATSLTASVLAGMGVRGVAGWSVALAVGVMTFLIVMFGEVLPKTYARHNPRRIVPFFPVTLAACFLLRPFSWFLEGAAARMIRGFGGSVGDTSPSVTEAEIETMIRLGSAQGTLTGDKRELLSSVIEFSETMIKEVMVPRMDVVGFALDAPLDEVLKTTAEKGFSRYPVYDGDLDSPVGIVTTKDLLGFMSVPDRGPFLLGDLARRHKSLIVPETKKIGELLKEFQREHVQMAVAVDEFGGSAGIVTMEDVIEEIVGEIFDEHEKSEPHMKPASEGAWVVQARTPIEELGERFGVELPEQDNFETVGGLVMTQLGRVPAKGEVVQFEGLRFEVTERTRTRVITVLVSRDVAAPAADDGEAR